MGNHQSIIKIKCFSKSSYLLQSPCSACKARLGYYKPTVPRFQAPTSMTLKKRAEKSLISSMIWCQNLINMKLVELTTSPSYAWISALKFGSGSIPTKKTLSTSSCRFTRDQNIQKYSLSLISVSPEN